MTSAAEKIAERALPQVYTVLFEAGGWAAVEGFAAVYAGRYIRVPRVKLGDHHPIVQAAGRAAADALVERYGGDPAFEVPMGGHSLRLLIVRDNLDLPVNKLAGLLGCTYRHAWNLRKEAMAGKSRDQRRRGRPPAPPDPRQTHIEDFLK
jgi:hypothetical protein